MADALSRRPPIVIKADMRLKYRIGVSLRNLWSEERIHSAQAVLDDAKGLVVEQCIHYARDLRWYQQQVTKDTLFFSHKKDMLMCCLNLKASAGMAGYPLASNVSEMLYYFLYNMQQIDHKSLEVVQCCVDAIHAVFHESHAQGGNDLSREVVRNLEQMTWIS